MARKPKRRAYDSSSRQEGARATLFQPRTTPAAAYKAWIAGSLATRGAVIVDDGAAAALRAGKSLVFAEGTVRGDRDGREVIVAKSSGTLSVIDPALTS